MSTSSGIVQKGEKGRGRFQSLDINNLYRGSDSEPAQQKGSNVRIKNGMQSLGKVPTARRAPANLPSIKSENTGSEPAVNLVPTGAAGWGSKPGEGPLPPQQNVPAASGVIVAPPQPVAPVIVPQVIHEAPIRGPMPPADKSWSATVMTNTEQSPNFLVHQSPQFQQEFPKLASEGGPQGKAGDAQYGPGPLLRPQTEGSWSGGGGRPQPGGPGAPAPPSLGPGPHIPQGPDSAAARTNLAPHPVQGVAMGPAGPGVMPLPQIPAGSYRPIHHPFMFPARGNPFPAGMQGMPRYSAPAYIPENRYPARAPPPDGEQPLTRPILREDELNKMDDIRDPGWAKDQELDYNQQLAFSDSEDTPADSKKHEKKDKEKERNRGKEDEKEKPDRRSEERAVDSRGNDWDRMNQPNKFKEATSLVGDRSRHRKDDDGSKRNTMYPTDEPRKDVKDYEADGTEFPFPDFPDRGRNRAGSDSADDKPRTGERNSRMSDRDRDDRDNKYFRPGPRPGDYRSHQPNLPPRLRAQQDRSNQNMMRSTGSPQPASGGPPPANNLDPLWTQPKRYDDGPDKREEERGSQYADRHKSQPRERYDDYRHGYDRKDDEIERGSDYKKPREPPSRPMKDDRKESSEERDGWREGRGNVQSTDSRDSESRGHQQRSDSRDLRHDHREQDSRSHALRHDDARPHMSRQDESRPHMQRQDESRQHIQRQDESRSHGQRQDESRSHGQRQDESRPHIQRQDESKLHQRQDESRSSAQRQEDSRSRQDDSRSHTMRQDSRELEPRGRDPDGRALEPRGHPQRPDSRDPDARPYPHRQEPEMRGNAPRQEPRNHDYRNASQPRAEGRDQEPRGPARQDSRDMDARSYPARQDAREMDIRNHRADTRDTEPRSQPQRADNRDSDSRGYHQRPEPEPKGHLQRSEAEPRHPPPRIDSRDGHTHPGYPQRPDSRDPEHRSGPQRAEQDSRSHPPRPESRDSRNSREDDKEHKEDRAPTRPDSRESRTSRDSRNSHEKHDSDSKSNRGFAQNQYKDEKDRKDLNTRHTPGPITRDKLDASERGDRKSQRPVLTQLRANGEEPEEKPAPATNLNAEIKTEETKVDKKENKEPEAKQAEEKHKANDRPLRTGGGRDRHWSATTFVRRRGPPRGGEAESGSSGEGGSELGKGEKDERNRETKREGFAPSGRPSRLGRGSGARVRGAGGSGRRVDGYGPPPVKAPFSQAEPVIDEEEDRTKQKQAALNAGIAGPGARATAAASQRGGGQRTNPRRDSARGKNNRLRRPPGKAGAEGEDGWDETISNSDGEDRKRDDRSRRYGGRSPNRGRGGASGPRTGSTRTNVTGSNATDTTGSRFPAASAETTEAKPEETAKSKPTEESEPSQPVGFQDRKKNVKDSFRGGPKSESSNRGPPPKDKRPKPSNQSTTVPNPNGPQPLMSQVVSPPPTMKNYENNQWRPNNMPPRFLKKQQQQQQPQVDNQESNKTPGSVGMFSVKSETLPSTRNAWEKPLGPPSKSPVEQGPSEASSQRSSPGGKLPPRAEPLLDDVATPVTTIIFENTNLKAGVPTSYPPPCMKPQQQIVEKLAGNERKLEDPVGLSSFGKPELTAEPLVEPSMKLPLYRGEQNNVAMDFAFNTESQDMNEEKSDLNFKVASTKKLWEPSPPEQADGEQNPSAVFPTTFCQDAGIDAASFGKVVDGAVPDDCSMMHPGEVVYNPQAPMSANYGNMAKQDPSTSSNVCKVKPQVVMSSGHSPLGPGGPSLTPPPFNSSQPSQFGYQQAGLGNTAGQFGGVPAIPSPPTIPYSSQPMQQNPLFQTFQMETRGNQYPQYTPQYPMSGSLGTTSAYNQPASLYLPPSPADLYPSLSPFRMTHPSNPFGQSQMNSNPNTVLLTSNTNSLMSASVKPSSQNIGTIGSKANAFQPSSQLFYSMESIPIQNYMQSSGMVQRAAPVPSPATNYFSNSTPAPQTGFYGTPQTTLGQPCSTGPQLQANYGFGNQSTSLGLQNYSQVNVQQFRTPSTVGPAPYVKSGLNSNSTSQHDSNMLATLNLVSQFPSPKNRPQKQMNLPPPQQSPTQPPPSKFGPYSNSTQLVMPQQQQMANNQQRIQPGGMGLQGVRGGGGCLYPNPIQRPNNSRNNRPTPQQQRAGGKCYFEAQDGNMKLEESSDLNKADDSCQMNCEPKLAEPAAPSGVDGPEDDSAKPKE